LLISHSHTSFTVSDLDRSVRFYTEVLGMKPGMRWERTGPGIESIVGVRGARMKMATVMLGDFTLELIQYVGGGAAPINPKINQPGTAHIGFMVDDVDGFAAALRQNGVRFYGTPASVPPAGSPEGTKPPPGVRGVYFADPDGITLEIAQRLQS
jgi:catechol 2,3-dioxygenase-like lactoylglutathione lyase family enzyme